MAKRKKREYTAEELAVRKEALSRGRVTAAANRAAKAAAGPEDPPEPVEQNEPVRDADDPVPLELTAEELARVQEEAKKKIDAELAVKRAAERKALIAKALDDEIMRQRNAAGLVDYRDDMVRFMINVAPFSPGIDIDGRRYAHGEWVTTPRREYDTIREAMARSWESEDRAGNPNKKFQQERQMAGIVNPMLVERRMSDGTFTVGAPISVSANGVVRDG